MGSQQRSSIGSCRALWKPGLTHITQDSQHLFLCCIWQKLAHSLKQFSVLPIILKKILKKQTPQASNKNKITFYLELSQLSHQLSLLQQ